MGNKTIILIAFVAMLGGLGVATYFNQPESVANTQNAHAPNFQGFALNPARTINVPTLYKDDGTLFTNNDIKNHWSLLFFGYTNCPDICPTTMNVLAQSLKQAKEKSIVFPNVYFISVDPQRDTTDILGEYVHYFDASFTGVTGESKMIEALTLQSGVVYTKLPVDEKEKKNYVVDHSASILVINPEGKLKAYLKPPHSPQTILNSLNKLTI